MKGTKFSRLLFQLQPKTLRIAETDAGLLPTPTAMMDEAPIEKVDARNQKQMEKGNSPFILGLGQQAMRGMLPTPRTADAEGGCVKNVQMENGNYFRTNKEGVRWGVKLRDVVESGMLPTPTVMDSTNNGDMTAAAKLMQGATHRSSGQPIQKTLTMEIHQQILADNQPLMEELANKPMLKRTNLPPQKEFVEWIRSVTNAKELSQMIDVKMSTAEHWFRMDAKGFSHPSIEEWIKIAEIFQVTEQMNARMMEQSSIEWTGMLPTPTVMDSTNATATMKSTQVKEGSMHSVTLTRAMAMGMLPTPNASDWNTATKPETYEARRQRHAEKGVNLQMTLRQMAMLPTPQAQEGEKITGLENQDSMTKRVRQITGTTSQLNPRFVAEMMGFPVNWTELPFQSGEQNQSKDTAMP
jgi:hypothetical protein